MKLNLSNEWTRCGSNTRDDDDDDDRKDDNEDYADDDDDDDDDDEDNVYNIDDGEGCFPFSAEGFFARTIVCSIWKF